MTTRKGPAKRPVLFLYSETGGGHRTAAQAIESALARIAPAEQRVRTKLVDAVAVCGEFPLREGILSYGALLKVQPSPYAAIYHLTDGRKRYQVLGALGKPFILRKFRALLRDEPPSLVVSVHPLLNVLARQTLDELELDVPLVTVITDLVTIHHSWTAGAAADHYIVPSAEAFEVCVAREIPAARVHDIGLPIREGFVPPPHDAAALRRSLGLDSARKVLLAMAGGEGAGSVPRFVVELAPLLRSLAVQLVIVTGRNRQLRRRLSSNRELGGAKVLGFVENIADYMRAADALLTKAGPGTIAEAAACGLPLIVCDYISGQEAGNLDYVRERGSGVVALDSAALADSVEQLLGTDSSALNRLREAALLSARPNAAVDAARLLGAVGGLFEALPARTGARA